MYGHSVVLSKCREYCWLPYLEKVKIGCIQDLELSYMQLSCCQGFTAAKIIKKKSQVRKEKFLHKV